jgi:ATP-dependent Clp protease ATP-binding subunit ClpA
MELAAKLKGRKPDGRTRRQCHENEIPMSMKLSPSIDVIWRLAASEMVAGQFKEIEPAHFCMALLKFAELPAAAVEAIDKPPGIAKAVAADVELLREALQKCGIESTRARRELRRQLGKGGAPCQDGPFHRSAASRGLFEAAALLAESGGEMLTPMHLLTALVESPTLTIAQVVLGKTPLAPAPATVLLLEKHGRDLVKEASNGNLRIDPAAEASSKAVLQILLQRERKSILLITDHDDLAQIVAIAIACRIAEKDPPPGLKGSRLVDIAASSRLNAHEGLRPSLVEGTVELDRLRQLLAEAASRPEIILLVPEVEAGDKSAWAGQWARLLRETLANGAVQFICRTTPAVFKEHLCKDVVWKRHAEAVWLGKAAIGSVPREL